MQMQNGMIVPALAATLAVSVAIGVVNGLGAMVMRIPPLVMTLGMAGVLQGALVLLTRGRPSGKAAPLLTDFINQPLVLGIPGILFIWAAIGAALEIGRAHV